MAREPLTLLCSVRFLKFLKPCSKSKHQFRMKTGALIHPQIVKVSQKLFVDGHYSNAARDAFIEINDRVKKLYKTYHPEAIELPGWTDFDE